MNDNYQEHLDYVLGAELGGPRRCPRHPNQVTSSPDGMFDCPCAACEAEGEEGAAMAEYGDMFAAGDGAPMLPWLPRPVVATYSAPSDDDAPF